MKTIDEYTIYCTEEQTKKAFMLGAPLITMRYDEVFESGPVIHFDRHKELKHLSKNGGSQCAYIPTAEQLIGWIDDQGIALDIHTYFKVDNGKIHHYQFTVTDSTRVFNGEYSSRKEATLAAIDAALDYLIKNKK